MPLPKITSTKSSGARIALTFAAWFALVAFVYRGTESNFLRAESGWYLLLSHSDAGTQDHFCRIALTTSFNGHYAPIAFLAEFCTAKIVSTTAAFWKWRQVALVALLATAVYELARLSGRLLADRSGDLVIASAGAAVAAVIVFQPNMKDFIAWPFMSLQLMWLLSSVLALAAMLKTVEAPHQSRWPWLAAGAAYGSLHFLGLGLATVAATVVLLLAGIAQRTGPNRQKKDLLPVGALLLITILHGIVMLRSTHGETAPADAGLDRLIFFKTALAFLPNFAIGAIRGLFSVAPPVGENWWTRAQWPYGAACLLVAMTGVGALLFRDFRHPANSVPSRARSSLIVFSVISFLSIVGLIAARQLRDPAGRGFADFLVGSRYLLPANCALIGAIIVLVLEPAGRIPRRLYAALSAIIVLAVVLGQDEYSRHTYPKVEPRATISHDAAWKSVTAMARQSRDAGLPIPNVPLEMLTQDFPGWDLKLFEPLLRAELGLPQGTALEFADWKEFSPKAPEEYARRVPALQDVARNLGLPAPTAH